MNRLATILCAVLLVLGAVPPAASEEDAATKRGSQAMTMALAHNYLLTLQLFEDGQTYTFTMAVASRHFTMSLGEKSIKLAGRIWGDGEEDRILDYTLEYTHWLEADPGQKRAGSTWNGSTYIVDGKPVEIVRFLNGAFSLELSTID